MKRNLTPPDMILLFITSEVILHYILPIKQMLDKPYNYLGIVLIILGLIPSLFVFLSFRKLRTTMKPWEMPDELDTSGLFKISRNPIYLGMLVILIGVAVWLGSVTPFIFPVLFVILTDKFVIPHEEKNLEKRFGERYLEYKKRVRRWI